MLIKNILLTFFSIILTLLFIELTMRLIGTKPKSFNKITSNEPVTNEPDDILGWIPKEGVYEFEPWSDNGVATRLTINTDGSRKTGDTLNNKKIIFIGGSITQGWAVSDDETFQSLLQKKNHSYKIKNYGVGGYGGYQSLLFLKKILKKNKNINLVIYGFIPHHEVRNIATGSWVYLLNQYSSRGSASLPYGSLDKNNNLFYNTPISYKHLPFGDKSFFINKIEKKILKIKSMFREKNKFEISKAIILEMKKRSEESSSDFKILFLEEMFGDNLNKYKNFLLRNKIEGIHCSMPQGVEYTVKNEGHPNFRAHKIISSCLYNNLAILRKE